MNEAIRNEQKKFADQLKNLSQEDFEKKSLMLACWLQGYQIGYQSAIQNRNDDK